MERATGCAKGSLNDTTVQLCSILGGDTGAISALRILHLYMERLGCDFQVSNCCPLLSLLMRAVCNHPCRTLLASLRVC